MSYYNVKLHFVIELFIKKEGRRNHYEPQLHKYLRHPLEENITIGKLIAGLQKKSRKD